MSAAATASAAAADAATADRAAAAATIAALSEPSGTVGQEDEDAAQAWTLCFFSSVNKTGASV
jgi:hypothetical protein